MIKAVSNKDKRQSYKEKQDFSTITKEKTPAANPEQRLVSLLLFEREPPLLVFPGWSPIPELWLATCFGLRHSQDYRCTPPHPAVDIFFLIGKN